MCGHTEITSCGDSPCQCNVPSVGLSRNGNWCSIGMGHTPLSADTDTVGMMGTTTRSQLIQQGFSTLKEQS